ncbi:hypothetical protein HX773_11590 [Pantoea sp. B9002]|uniref:hypothetical protein n=1 Tax=Pantoea sp. B9002 TaxID=2726979 RepID=UPI0015A286B5|nr:hypothetical protein [Pantoea sp. B9002]NWA61528.1 hypothetical protein [Pantoea sp. B9002]
MANLLLKAALLLAIIVSFSTVAFFSNITIGGVSLPCAAFCGDKGVINPNFFGDAVNNLALGSSIDALDEKLKTRGEALITQSESKLNLVLDDKIAKLNELASYQREEFLRQLNNSSDRAISDLNNTLRTSISDTDVMIEKHQGILLGQLTSSILTSGQVLLFVGGGISIIAITCLAYYKRANNIAIFSGLKFRSKKVFIIFTVVFITGFLITVLTFWIGGSSQKKYVSAYNDNEFSNATIFSGALLFENPGNRQFQIFNIKSQALRDMIVRPTLLMSSEVTSYNKRLSQASEAQYEITQSRDPDLETLQAIVNWRTSDRRLGEYYSAVHSYFAIKNRENKIAGQHFLLEGLAQYYLGVYALNPLSDSDLEMLKFNRESINTKLDKIHYTFPTNDELIDLSKRYPAQGWAYDYQKLHLSIISKYSAMILAHSENYKMQPEMRSANIGRELDLAKKIISEWDDFTKTHIDINDLRQVSMALSGLYPIYARAISYKNTLSFIDNSVDLSTISLGNILNNQPTLINITGPSDLIGQPCVGWPFHLSVMKNIPPRDPNARGIYEEWLTGDDSSASMRAIKLAAKNKQIVEEDKLFAFEYFTYLSEMVNLPEVVGCYEPGTAKALTSATDSSSQATPILPPSATPTPSQTMPAEHDIRHIMFERKFNNSLFKPTVSPAVINYKLTLNDILFARHHAIFEASGIGLFVCGENVEEFLNCDTSKPRITVSQLLFNNFKYKSFLAVGALTLADKSKSARVFPKID